MQSKFSPCAKISTKTVFSGLASFKRFCVNYVLWASSVCRVCVCAEMKAVYDHDIKMGVDQHYRHVKKMHVTMNDMWNSTVSSLFQDFIARSKHFFFFLVLC